MLKKIEMGNHFHKLKDKLYKTPQTIGSFSNSYPILEIFTSTCSDSLKSYKLPHPLAKSLINMLNADVAFVESFFF